MLKNIIKFQTCKVLQDYENELIRNNLHLALDNYIRNYFKQNKKIGS